MSDENFEGTEGRPHVKGRPVACTRNVMVSGLRTSMRLEAPFWDALEEILRREDMTLNELVTRIKNGAPTMTNLSSAVRVFVQSYFYALAKQKTPRLPAELNWKTLFAGSA